LEKRRDIQKIRNMDLQLIQTSKLYDSINRNSKNLRKNIVLLSYIRAINKDTFEIELVQKRCVDRRIFTGRYVLPDIKRGHYSLLFNKLTFTCEGLIEALPELKLDYHFLQDILKKGSQYILGKPAVFVSFNTITKFYRSDIDQIQTPIIMVKEYTREELKNIDNIKELCSEGRGRDELFNEENILKEDYSPVIDGNTGEVIYRFTKTSFVEENLSDRIIEYKLNERDYEKIKSGQNYLSWEW